MKNPAKAKKIRQQNSKANEKYRLNPDKACKRKAQRKAYHEKTKVEAVIYDEIKRKNLETKKKAFKNPLKKKQIQKQRYKAVKKFRNKGGSSMQIDNEIVFHPPIISHQLKMQCINDYREATSLETLKFSTCGICGTQSKTEKIEIGHLPNKHLLQQSECSDVLPMYRHHGLILVPQGICNDFVNCCDECLGSLKNNKLPACSTANNLQFGNCPNQLKGLTIPEKLLI